ncbi:MAG TPA: phosphodiester glycosidase family protein [Gemmatimonadaceae bacterium]|nr:phosphodiester glycosidase family protein [Gemmatimonadaceae bacterium]
MPENERNAEPGRHVPVARISAVAALLVVGWLLLQGRDEPHWRTIAPGVEFTTLRGEPWCRAGSSEVGVLRLDPSHAVVRVAQYGSTAANRPLNIVEWQQETGAIAVFNAGQFYPDWSYMGLLVSGGHTLSKTLHPGFKGALVAGPAAKRGREPARAIRVLDLAHDSIDAKNPGWREVAQSFMVIDRDGGVRVRSSDKVANRTIVAEDKRGRVLVFTSEGGYTLRDFAEFMKHAPLGVAQAMAMDGGWEAEMCVRTRDFRYASFGRWEAGHEDTDAPGARALLPVVIAVESK